MRIDTLELERNREVCLNLNPQKIIPSQMTPCIKYSSKVLFILTLSSTMMISFKRSPSLKRHLLILSKRSPFSKMKFQKAFYKNYVWMIYSLMEVLDHTQISHKFIVSNFHRSTNYQINNYRRRPDQDLVAVESTRLN